MRHTNLSRTSTHHRSRLPGAVGPANADSQSLHSTLEYETNVPRLGASPTKHRSSLALMKPKPNTCSGPPQRPLGATARGHKAEISGVFA